MIANQSGIEKQPIPVGSYPAYCFALVGMGFKSTSYGPLELVRLIFEFPTLPWVDENDSDRTGVRTISNEFPLKLGNVTQPSELAKFLQQWRNRAFEKDDFKEFDLCNILGAPAIITVSQQEGERSVYNQIKSICPAKRRSDKSIFYPGNIPSEEFDFPEKFHENLYLDHTNPDLAVVAKLPKWVKSQLVKNNVIEADSHHERQPVQPPGQGVSANQPAEDDDLPF